MASKSVDPELIPGILAKHRDESPAAVQHYYLTIEDQWERRLWHELTLTLLEYFGTPESAKQRIPLFDDFIRSFASKINQLKLVALGLEAATQCHDDAQRIAFLTALAKAVDKPASQDAFVLASAHVAGQKLATGAVDGAAADLSKCESILDAFDTVDTGVHAAFYRTSSDLRKAQRDFAGYYKNTLLYLACVDVASLPAQERLSRARDLAHAALLSDAIYNFGELLVHPILDALRHERSAAWLVELVFAFNRGDLAVYERLAPQIKSDALLSQHIPFLHQKISLAALTEAAFRRPPHERAMTFSEIEAETRAGSADVEHLVMKALSLGLLRGSIDQVAGVADITWVQPKVLDMAAVQNMATRLGEWDSSVNHLGTWIEGVGKEVWAA